MSCYYQCLNLLFDKKINEKKELLKVNSIISFSEEILE